MINRVPEKKSQFQKIRKLQNLIHFNKQGISCLEILLDSNFNASSKCCKRMEQSLPLAIGIYRPLNWVHITVMSMGKYHLLL